MPKAGLKRQTAQALLKALGVDTNPIHLSVLATVLDGLSPEDKADLVQFLGGSDQDTRRAALAAVEQLEEYIALPVFYSDCLPAIRKALT